MLRVGFGFDSHEFEDGKSLYLGGVLIDHSKGLRGHSDSDVLLHAITDAILGALGEPDIGELFPNTDPTWKDQRSEVFLKEALRRMRDSGYKIINLDCAIITDAPKIFTIKEKIRKSLTVLLGVNEGSISLKGKTREGFCKEDGIVCMCVILLGHES
ncbi:MAG: 2-C-methyl-D-erythritol 2,4-cyclodiphosphate synthase [Aquificaceae bacterium]